MDVVYVCMCTMCVFLSVRLSLFLSRFSFLCVWVCVYVSVRLPVMRCRVCEFRRQNMFDVTDVDQADIVICETVGLLVVDAFALSVFLFAFFRSACVCCAFCSLTSLSGAKGVAARGCTCEKEA